MQPHQQSSCEEYWRDISTLMDNALVEQRKISLLDHIKGCPNCFLELETQQQIEKLVQDNLTFLTKNVIDEKTKNTIANSIMERVRKQNDTAEEYRQNPDKPHMKATHDHGSDRGAGSGEATPNNHSGVSHHFLFNPRPIIITSAASLLILVGSSTSMLYSFSSVQHEALSDGTTVIMVSDAETPR